MFKELKLDRATANLSASFSNLNILVLCLVRVLLDQGFAGESSENMLENLFDKHQNGWNGRPPTFLCYIQF